MPYARSGRTGARRTKYLRARRKKYTELESHMAATERRRTARKAVEEQNAKVLREYLVTHNEKLAVDKDDRRLKRLVEAIPDGQHGNYLKTYGNPRTVTDLDAVAKRYAELGEEVPTKLAHPLVVRRITDDE